MKHENENNWIEEVMHSLDHVQRAEPQPFLYTRIMARIGGTTQVARRYIWLTAAGLACLLLVNVLVLKTGAGRQNPGMQNLAEQINWNMPSTVDYN